MFGQYEASRIWRFAQEKAIPCNVSSLTHEQFDISKDSNSGHDVTAERIAASKSLWQEAISSSRKRGQLRTALGMLLRLRDRVSSWGHLKRNTAYNNEYCIGVYRSIQCGRSNQSPDGNTEHSTFHYLKVMQSIMMNRYFLESSTQHSIIDSQTPQCVAIS